MSFPHPERRILPGAALTLSLLIPAACTPKEGVQKSTDQEANRSRPATTEMAPELEPYDFSLEAFDEPSLEAADTPVVPTTAPSVQTASVESQRRPEINQLQQTFNFSDLSPDPAFVDNASLFFSHFAGRDGDSNYTSQLVIPPGRQISVNAVFGDYACYSFMAVAGGVTGGGACHATSMLREVAEKAGLEVELTYPDIMQGHIIGGIQYPIGGVDQKYWTAVWCSDPNLDVLIKNPGDMAAVIGWKVENDRITFTTEEEYRVPVDKQDLTMDELRYVDAVSVEDLNNLLPQRIKDNGFTGEDLVRIAKENNVNPGVLWAFAWADSHWGESAVGKTGNVIGISNDSGPSTDLTIEQSLEIGAQAMDGILKKVNSFSEFAYIWAPPEAPNDYNDTNNEWPALVTRIYWDAIGPVRSALSSVMAQSYNRFLDQGKVIQYLPYSDEVALTFDVEEGAESPDKLPAILDILDREDVKASFFILGKWGAEHPDLLREITRRGHLIANHGENHPDYTKIDAEKVTEDVEEGAKVIAYATGINTDFFRLPYGRGTWDPNLIKTMGNLGYNVFGWSIDTRDWEGRSADDIALMINNAWGGDIILMHPHALNTACALPAVIYKIKAKGLELVRLDQGL